MAQYQYPFKNGKFVYGTPFGRKGNYWKSGYHSGLDLKSRNYGGDGKVYPICSGKVQKVTRNGSYGNCVYILHDDGYLSLYAHLSRTFVLQGQKVDLDTVIGVEGTTGNSTGVHLHIEIHKGKYGYPASINPDKFIQEKIKEGEEVEIKKLSVLKDGQKVIVSAVEVEGSNYIKLRDLEQLAPITVGYNAATKQVSVTTKKAR